MWKFVDMQSILHIQRQLIFNYSSATHSWAMDKASRNMVAESLQLPVTARCLDKAISALEVECSLWAYGRHPERDYRSSAGAGAAAIRKRAKTEVGRKNVQVGVPGAVSTPSNSDYSQLAQ